MYVCVCDMSAYMRFTHTHTHTHRYHLFGETVTLAETMESTGVAGMVVVCGHTYDKLDEEFTCKKINSITVQSKKKELEMQRYVITHIRGLEGVSKKSTQDTLNHAVTQPTSGRASGRASPRLIKKEVVLSRMANWAEQVKLNHKAYTGLTDAVSMAVVRAKNKMLALLKSPRVYPAPGHRAGRAGMTFGEMKRITMRDHELLSLARKASASGASESEIESAYVDNAKDDEWEDAVSPTTRQKQRSSSFGRKLSPLPADQSTPATSGRGVRESVAAFDF
jgi:hypothetical protein